MVWYRQKDNIIWIQVNHEYKLYFRKWTTMSECYKLLNPCKIPQMEYVYNRNAIHMYKKYVDDFYNALYFHNYM